MAATPLKPPRAAVERTAYGDFGPQFVDFYEPSGARLPAAVVVLIHGGYWRDRIDLSIMEPLAADALSRGMAVANVEYRRVGSGGGWPVTGMDIANALTHVGEHWKQWRGLIPFISVGHSVGGQLALLNAAAVDAVVALAPVTDVARADDERLGEDAAVDFMGARAADLPAAYAAASPLRNLPLATPVLAIHGDVDVRVPVAHTRDFVAAARTAGGRITYLEVPGLEHVSAIDPSVPHWTAATEWMLERDVR
jgi:acetyl esterase/lipase